MRTKQWDSFQRDLDYIGTVPLLGEPVDFINAGISSIRGDGTGALLSLASMIPVGGYLATAVKIQRHHIIPKAVFKEFKGELGGLMKRDGIQNLVNLPTPFHGNHPQYNNFVRKAINDLRGVDNLNAGSIKALQQDLTNMINKGLENYNATGQNLNDYFRP